MPTLTAAALAEFVSGIFVAAGVPAEDAAVVVDNLVGANLRGHDSHGVMRVPQYIDFLKAGHYRAGVDLVVEHQTPAVVVCDGAWGFGQVQAHRLLGLLIPKAQALGIAAGTIRQCGHIGRLGDYAERAATSGLVLIATVNTGGSGQRVAAARGPGAEAGDQSPVHRRADGRRADRPGLRHQRRGGRKGPGPLHQQEGRPRRLAAGPPRAADQQPGGPVRGPDRVDPADGGTQSYKGFGLGLMIDILSSGLAGGRMSHLDPPAPRGNNVMFLAMDPALFSGRDALIAEAAALADYVRGTPRSPGVEAILLPGDPERRTLDVRSRDGIPIEDAHWARLVDLAATLGLPAPAGSAR